MSALMLMTAIVFNGVQMVPIANDTVKYDSMDECIYELVEIQSRNTPSQFIIAGCVSMPGEYEEES